MGFMGFGVIWFDLSWVDRWDKLSRLSSRKFDLALLPNGITCPTVAFFSLFFIFPHQLSLLFRLICMSWVTELHFRRKWLFAFSNCVFSLFSHLFASLPSHFITFAPCVQKNSTFLYRLDRLGFGGGMDGWDGMGWNWPRFLL
jgi:hypothetical protein